MKITYKKQKILHKLKIIIINIAHLKYIHYLCIRNQGDNQHYNISIMRATVGTYHFSKHRSVWGIYVYDTVREDGFTTAKFVKDVCTYEDAVREVYALNGWGEPKSIKRVFNH